MCKHPTEAASETETERKRERERVRQERIEQANGECIELEWKDNGDWLSDHIA